MAFRATSRLHPALSYLAAVAGLAAVYFLMARVGLRFASIGHSVSLVWPPTGIALGALAILGYRFWPGIALGAFLANAASPVALPTAAAIAVGNTLEGLVAAFLLRRSAGPRPRLEVARSLRTLVFLAAPAGALVSAMVGATTLWMAGEISAHAIPSTLAVWWTGDLLGALVVAPVLLTWAASREPLRIPRGVLEITLLCLGTVVAAELVLGASPPAGESGLPLSPLSVRHVGRASVRSARRRPDDADAIHRRCLAHHARSRPLHHRLVDRNDVRRRVLPRCCGDHRSGARRGCRPGAGVGDRNTPPARRTATSGARRGAYGDLVVVGRAEHPRVGRHPPPALRPRADRSGEEL